MTGSTHTPVQLADPGRDDLRRLLALSFTDPGRDDNDLHRAVLDLVRSAKAERRTPETIIVALKRAIADAAVARYTYRAANELTDRVVRWFLDAYYGADGPPADRGRGLLTGSSVAARS